MSNSYGIPDDIMRQLAEQYLAEQESQQPMLTGEQQNYAGAIPMTDLEGDPQSITSMLNQLKSVNSLMADPMFQLGGGVGGWSQQAFEPTVTWEQVESPEYQRWQNYRNTPDSFEGMVAAEIEGGGTPTSALRKIQAKVAENPEGPIAQQLLMFFPAEEDGIATGEIDWPMANQAAVELDEMHSLIPPLGNQAIMAPDGTRIGGGEIVEVEGPDGQMQLLRRVEEPSPMMEKFNEMGIPSPFEEYTPEMFMGQDWVATRDAWDAENAAPQLDQAIQDAYRAYMDFEPQAPQQGDWSDFGVGEREQPEGTNMVGTTEDVPLVEGPGMAEHQAEINMTDRSEVDWQDARATYDERMRWTNPAEFEEWYNANANTMTDEQRMSVIADLLMRGENQMNGIGDIGVRQQGLEMVQLAERLQDDMEEFSPEPMTQVAAEVASDVGNFLEGGEREPTPAEAAEAQAMQIHNAAELRQFLSDHPEISPDRYADIGGQALSYSMGGTGPEADAMGKLASELMNGDFVPSGGGGGNRPQVRVAGKMAGKAGQRVRGEEPVPPPEDLAWAGGPTELFGGGRETPAPPGTEPPGIFDQLTAGPPRGGSDWITAEPPGDLSPDVWRDTLLSWLLPQYAVGGRAGELEDEAIRAGQNAVRPTPTSPPGSEGAPWQGLPTSPPGSEGAPWQNPPTSPPGSEGAPQGSRAEYLLPGITEDRQLAEGKMAAARAQEALGNRLPDYLLPYSREAMLQAIMPNYPTTTGAVNQQQAALAAGHRIRQESIENQDRPEGISEDDWQDFLLSSVMPNYPTTRAARENQQAAVAEGANLREREMLLPGITQDMAIALGQRAAARNQEEQGYELPDYLYPHGTEFMLQNILPNYPTTQRAQEGEQESVAEGHRIRRRESLLPGITQDEAIAEGKRAAARAQEALGHDLPDYLTPYGTEFMLQSILPNYPATQRAQELQQQALHEGNRIRSISNLQQREAMLQAILPTIRTGERTAEEREALARERAPRGLQGEQYEVTTNMGGGTGQGRRKVFGDAVRRANRYRVQRGLERQELYGEDWGRAIRAVRNAQLSGASPAQQVFAQRMANILNAGIPLGNQPNVVQY